MATACFTALSEIGSQTDDGHLAAVCFAELQRRLDSVFIEQTDTRVDVGGGMTLFRSGSILNVSAGASQSGTCLMQTIRFSGTPLPPSRPQHPIASLAPDQRLSTSSAAVFAIYIRHFAGKT
jgi:hypothetical protein